MALTLVSLLAAALLLFVLLSQERRMGGWLRWPFLAVGFSALAALVSQPVLQRLSNGYSGDYFFSLSLLESFGLVLLALLLAALAFSCFVLLERFAIKTLGRGGAAASLRLLLLNLLIALAVFYLLVWVAPQGYYAYSKLISADLPGQWVAKLPSLDRGLELLRLHTRPSMGEHALGLLGRGLLFFALLTPLEALWGRKLLPILLSYLCLLALIWWS